MAAMDVPMRALSGRTAMSGSRIRMTFLVKRYFLDRRSADIAAIRRDLSVVSAAAGLADRLRARGDPG